MTTGGDPADPADAAKEIDEADEALNRAIKESERRMLHQSALPLIASGIGVCVLYTYMGTILVEYWLGAGVAFAGAVLALVGYLGRLRETSRPGEPNTRHWPLLLLAGVLVFAGLYLPPYSSR